MRVLVADDDVFYRNYVCSALERWGYEVITASEGNEAARILQGEDPPNIAILDWMMPGMDGVAICSQEREQSKDAYVYIILITVKNQKSDVIAGFEAQADDYLIKPFDFEELRIRLISGCRIISVYASYCRLRDLNEKRSNSIN